MKKLIYFLIILSLFFIACETTGEKNVNDINTEKVSNARKHFDFAREYAKNKEWDSAIRNYDAAIKDSAGYEDAYIGLGKAYEGKFDNQNAIKTYNTFNEKFKKNPNGYIALGQLYTKTKQYDNAEKAFNDALKIDGNNANAWFGMGKMYEEKYGGNEGILKAITCYEKACGLDPEDLTIAYTFGKSLLKLGRYKEAQEFLEKVVVDYPLRTGPISNLAEAYLESKEYKKAVEAYKKTIELDSTIVDAYLGLARSYQGYNDFANAEKAYLNLAKVQPQSTVPYLYLGQMFLNNKNYDKAINYLNTVLSRNPNDESAMLLIAQCYFFKADPKLVKNDADRENAYKNLEISEDFFNKIINRKGAYSEQAKKGIENIKSWRKVLDPTRW